MPFPPPLVGRDAETERIAAAVERAGEGEGSLLLLCGDAGVGKTRLAEEATSGVTVLRGAATEGSTAPYGPIVAALRARLRAGDEVLAEDDPLRPHLSVLLPELGAAAATTDRAAIFEAV